MHLALALCFTQAYCFTPNAKQIPSRVVVGTRVRAVLCEASAPQQQATLAASIVGLASQPVMWWSLYVLKTTGCGLPAGPFGLIGAAEGISYLVIIGFVASSMLSKVTSGKGLPAGPGGLLGVPPSATHTGLNVDCMVSARGQSTAACSTPRPGRLQRASHS